MKLILRVVILSWPVLFLVASAQSQFARQPVIQNDPLLGVDGGGKEFVIEAKHVSVENKYVVVATPAHWAEGNLPPSTPPGG